MTDMPLGERLHRIASLRFGRPLREVSDPAAAPVLAGPLGAVADPPVTDPASLAALAGALAGNVDPLPPGVAGRLAAGLGLPADVLDAGTDFRPAEDDLLRAFLSDRGVVDIRSCRGGRGRTGLLDQLGLVDRVAAGSGNGAA